uniref:Cytochrome c oxidase subunit 3 n=1 Tax=Mellinus arvensis TaxID=1507147 RepID=A0A7L7S0Y7_9HYME|nr:cytochrome c oxidase subunit III [Mellinus arvensis]
MFHPFHMVTLSPWPLYLSLNLLNFMMSSLLWMNFKDKFGFISSLIVSLLIVYQWWRDVVRESTFQGYHTRLVGSGLRLGMCLFIVSELFFFVSIFWCYFHSALSPSVEIGSSWPPENVKLFNPYGIPLLNTMILISSGFSITWSHHSMLSGDMLDSAMGLMLTLLMGFWFSYFQVQEYKEAFFSFSDGIYGSVFYLATGFHGLHVFIGTVFLVINYCRLVNDHFKLEHHLGFEFSIWYWHFVDIVWLFLYMFVYWWVY